jgi:RimJ/RimL family protein N-acetyltransferase
LTLIAATLAHLEAELAGSPGALGRLLGAAVPPSWPPGEYDTAALTFFHAQLRDGGAAAVGWYGWYAIAGADGPAAALVGAGGFLGPPGPAGVVELGYSVTPEHRRQGYATELAACLVAHAWRVPEVRAIHAHTTAANVASVRVLERVGFAVAGAGAEPGQVRYVHRGPTTE